MPEVLKNSLMVKKSMPLAGAGIAPFLLIFMALVMRPAPVFSASSCLQAIWDDNTVSSMIIYPNWNKVVTSRQMLWMYAGGTAPENIVSMTVVNYGTAVDTTDIKKVYVRFYCGATSSATLTLTYAGIYALDSGAGKAWTWTGSVGDFSGCTDMCGAPYLCGGFFSADIIVDIGSCPNAGATIRMGFPSKNFVGSVFDNYNANPGCVQPMGDSLGPEHVIQYLYKMGPDKAIPGDTVEFTIYYGKPGGTTIQPMILTDSIPAYTHYVDGSATITPDDGWAPALGPPPKLRWTLPGPFLPAGGATGEMKFSISVDWGNGESFEPGSGNVGAPEGWRISNRIHGTYAGSDCAPQAAVSGPAQTTVNRFMMWLVGDNDILFAPSYGQPADEMIYQVFIKNISSTKTWWDVSIWDTLPDSLDVWGVDCGFEDPCAGWTMTPTGCAAAYPGRVVVGANTIVTWRLDTPPLFTISLRFKAKVKTTAAAGDTAVNVLSVLEKGKTSILEGTGSSVTPKIFAHIAPIILPTTYISYVSWGVFDFDEPVLGDAVTFFPLNKKAQFELRGLAYFWAPASGGAVSASIGCYLGDCIGGFPGSPGCAPNPIPSGPESQAGCKAERIPARFNFAGPPGTKTGYQHLYKITSNCPVNWQTLPAVGVQCGDYMTYAPSTTLSYVGLLHYFWKNSYNTVLHSGTSMFFLNVGKDPYGVTNTSIETTVHIFKFNYTDLAWDYMTTLDLAAESGGLYKATLLGEEGAYRSISSAGQLVAWQGYQAISTLGCGCPCYDNSTMMPTRESGNVVGLPGQTFYGVMQGYSNTTKLAITNVGAANASLRVYQYVPDLLVAPVGVPVALAGTSGTWLLKGALTIPTGWGVLGNPKIFAADGTMFDAASTAAFKVEVVSGGPVQLEAGARISAGWGGGSVVHASNPAGAQTGSEFWVTQIMNNDGTDGAATQVYAITTFCSKTGMAVRCETDDLSYSATFTTTGPDQAISFMSPTFDEPARWTNRRITRLPGVNGDIICQYMNAGAEKGYTAPFLQTGVHYEITMPPVVFVGTYFWITITVLEQGGTVKADYTGNTSFTSTDPAALIEDLGMEGYDYAWLDTDDGLKMFFKVRFSQLGPQSIVATDTMDGSVSGIAATMVVGADIRLEKRNKLSIAASGDTVQFRICWSSYASATAYSFTITDAVPRGTVYVPELSDLALCQWNGPYPPTVTMAASNSVTTVPPTNFAVVPAGSAPSGGNATRWLRWVIPNVYVNSTGCVCFKVVVN